MNPVEIIIDGIKLIMFLSIGIIIGICVGFIIAISGLSELYSSLPIWMLMMFVFLLSIGVLSLIAFFKKERIEEIKKVEK